MPIPSGTTVLARRYIVNVAGNPPPNVGNHTGIQAFVPLLANGKPNGSGQPTFYDIIDDNTFFIGNPAPKYICYWLNTRAYWVELDTFGPSDLAHNWDGWPEPGAPVQVLIP